MPKVLYIGHILQNSGWGTAIRNNCLALDAAGLEVVCRTIRLNGDSYQPEGKIKEFLERDSKGCDYCIQHVLPQFLVKHSSFKKCISYFVVETLNWNASGFHHFVNNMDELWCPNSEMAKNAREFIKCPVKVIPHACDITKYSKEYPKLDLNISGYNFYFIGEFIRRKRLSSILQAYHSEFRRTEPVNLIIKTSKSGLNPQQVMHEIQGLSNEVKKGLKLYKGLESYPNEVFITSFMSEDQIMGLHQLGNCYVSGSYGDAWAIPAFDGMAMGNAVVHSNCGGPRDFLEGYERCFPIEGRWENSFGNYETFQNYQTAKELWFNCDIRQMRQWMRFAYNQGKEKSKKGLEIAQEYSYERVGKLMAKALEE